MKRMEVRCCCQPQKLLGWLPVPEHLSVGQVVNFVISPAHWELLNLRSQPRQVAADLVRLPIAEFQDGGRPPYPALKSEETPIERLRLIPTFVENAETTT